MVRLSCGRIIHLLAHSLPTPLPSARCLSFSQSSWVSPIKLSYWREREELGRGAKSIHPRESLAFFRSFNTLCAQTLYKPAQNQWCSGSILLLKNCKIFPCLFTKKFGKRSSAVIWGKIFFICGNKWMFSQMWGTYSIFSPFSSYIYH